MHFTLLFFVSILVFALFKRVVTKKYLKCLIYPNTNFILNPSTKTPQVPKKFTLKNLNNNLLHSLVLFLSNFVRYKQGYALSKCFKYYYLLFYAIKYNIIINITKFLHVHIYRKINTNSNLIFLLNSI